MDFTASSGGGGDGGSYERPKVGSYLGILVGFAEIGTQVGGQYGPKRKIMLRWELHKRKGPSLDSAGHIHTITRKFGASFSDKSHLRPAVAAHGVPVTAGSRTSSRDWLGKLARITVTQEAGSQYVDVGTIALVDPEEDYDKPPVQVEPSEHWEIKDGGECPVWARHFWEKSTEFAQLNGTRQPVPAGRQPGDDFDPRDFL